MWRCRALASLLFCLVSVAQAQWAPIVLSPPPQDAIDENFVSVLTGKLHFNLPVLNLGDVSFAPYTTNQQFDKVISGGAGGTADSNYGHVVLCFNPGSTNSYA